MSKTRGALQATKVILPPPSKWRSFIVRAQTTLVLIGSFCLFIWMGHVPLMAMILGIQVGLFPLDSGTHSLEPGTLACLISKVSCLHSFPHRIHR